LAVAYLKEKKGIRVSKETVRQWMIQDGLWKPAYARKIPVSSWSPRRERAGALVHWYVAEAPWLGEENPSARFLISMVGDATSRAVARFSDLDSVGDNVALLREYMKQWGRPKEFRIGSVRVVLGDLRIEMGRGASTPDAEIQRILRRLDIAWSSAIPPASGRVEHFYGVAARGLRDRLKKNRVLTTEGANSYLTRFWLPNWNARQTVQPSKAEDAHRAVVLPIDEVAAAERPHEEEPGLICTSQ
jgi:hypothetical protein